MWITSPGDHAAAGAFRRAGSIQRLTYIIADMF